MEYDPSAFTLIRRILPRRSLVLPALRWASKAGLRSVRSSKRRVPVGLERVGVVTGGQVEVARGVEVDVAADVAADAPAGGHVEHRLLRAELPVRGEGEAGQPVDAGPGGVVGAGVGGVAGRGGQRRRVIEVDEPVGGEPGVDADALQAFLVVVVDRQRADHGGAAVDVGAPQCAVAGGVQDGPVRQHRQAHRLAHRGLALGQGDLLEVAGVDHVVGLGGRAQHTRDDEYRSKDGHTSIFGHGKVAPS